MAPPGSSFPPERLEILDAREGGILGLWRNVLVARIRAIPELEQLRRIHVVQGEVGAKFPSGFGVITILPALSPTDLSPEARDMAARIILEAAPQVLGLGLVVEGGGFLSAAIRSVATSLTLGTRPRWPTRIFAGIEPAAAWVSTWVEGESRPAATRKLTEAIRQSLV